MLRRKLPYPDFEQANSLILPRFRPCIINEMAKNAETNVERTQSKPLESLSTFSLVQ